MPSTVPYGFEFEALGDEPGRTLSGGEAANSPILAEQVNDELVRVENDLLAIQSDVSDLQNLTAGGWRFIGSGSESAAFNLDLTAGGQFPAGTFAMVRVYLRGSLSADGVRIQIRVNNDTTANLHRHGRIVFDPSQANNSNVTDSNSTAGTTWPVAEWSTATACTAIVTIFATDGASSLLGYQASGVRAGAAGNQRLSGFGGDLASGRQLENLQVFPVSGSISACRWWAEGLIVP